MLVCIIIIISVYYSSLEVFEDPNSVRHVTRNVLIRTVITYWQDQLSCVTTTTVKIYTDYYCIKKSSE